MQEGSRVFEFIFPITEFPFIKLQAWNFAKFLNKMQICVRKFSYMFFLCSIILPLVLRLSPIIFISLDKSAIRIVAAVYQVIEMLLWNAIDSLYLRSLICRYFMGIKPGPKRIAKSTGMPDRRQRDNKLTPGNIPTLKPHIHKKGD